MSDFSSGTLKKEYIVLQVRSLIDARRGERRQGGARMAEAGAIHASC